MERIWYIQHEGKSYAKHQRKLCIIVGGGGILRKHHIPLEKESRRYEQASTKFIRRVSKLYMNEPSSKTERPKCTYLSGPKALGTNVAKADSIAEWLESPSNCNKAVKNLDRLLWDRVTKKDCHAHETISCKAIVLSSLWNRMHTVETFFFGYCIFFLRQERPLRCVRIKLWRESRGIMGRGKTLVIW